MSLVCLRMTCGNSGVKSLCDLISSFHMKVMSTDACHVFSDC